MIFLFYVSFRAIFSALNYINMHNDSGAAPVFPLQLSAGCIFYIKDPLGEHNAFLGFFEIDSTPHDMNNGKC